MTPLREWLRPPRTLLLILFLLALVSVSALAWFGWKLLEQERIVEAQQSQERLEQLADRIAATVRSSLAETGERLGAAETAPAPAEAGLMLAFKDNSLTATPAGRLLYYPTPSAEPEASRDVFAAAELFEFTQSQPVEALRSYERLANSTDVATRAGALLRMARVLRASGRIPECRTIYERLAMQPGVKVAGVPAELVARHALAELSGKGGDATALKRNLSGGRWHLTRGQFHFYWSEAARLAGRQEQPSAEAIALSEAAALAWNKRKLDGEPRGQETIWIGDQPFFLIWRGTPERRAALLARPNFFLEQIPNRDGARCALVDANGHLVAGHRTGSGRAAVRTAAESQLPWTLFVSAADPLAATGLIAPQRFLLFGISVVALFLIFGTYFIARAIRRETEALRMQSDFVSAVSHEFRSPLTSMRQLSELLASGRVPSEGRRQLYYETLVQETSRLQRLIEALLNFGRMEAGTRQFRFEELDVRVLVERVAAEFEPQIAGSGRHIERSGPSSPCLIDADPDAISVALRNLLDNALKYSPGQPMVWVEWEVQDALVSIGVRDRGPGIAVSERKAIFRKFVRGAAATTMNVKGSGVGLAMVRHIVAAHGGEIALESETGQGSVFTMLLPLAKRPQGLVSRISTQPIADSLERT